MVDKIIVIHKFFFEISLKVVDFAELSMAHGVSTGGGGRSPFPLPLESVALFVPWCGSETKSFFLFLSFSFFSVISFSSYSVFISLGSHISRTLLLMLLVIWEDSSPRCKGRVLEETSPDLGLFADVYIFVLVVP